MLDIEKTPLKKVLDVCSSGPGLLYFPHTNNPLLDRYAFPAIKLGINPLIRYLPSGRYCIAGGVFRSLFFDEIPKDLDIYPLEGLQATGAIKKRMDNIIGDTSTYDRVKATRKTDNLEVDILNIEVQNIPYKFQIICKTINGTSMNCAEDVISSFDIVPACFAVDISLDTVQKMSGEYASFTLNGIATHPDYFFSVGNKYLMVNDQTSMFSEKRMKAERFYKYIANYGFRIPNNSEMMKFNKLLENPSAMDVDIDYE